MAPSLIKDGVILLKTLHFLTIGVIISTYNNPAWLEKTLWGYLNQTRPADEILIADDGSTDETRKLIESFTEKSAASNQEKSAASNRGALPIKHIWQEDRGFQKSQILNKALVAATAEYLIFTDQDCVPRKDFIEDVAQGFIIPAPQLCFSQFAGIAVRDDVQAAGQRARRQQEKRQH